MTLAWLESAVAGRMPAERAKRTEKQRIERNMVLERMCHPPRGRWLVCQIIRRAANEAGYARVTPRNGLAAYSPRQVWSGRESVRLWALNCGPFEGLPAVGECTHLNSLAITEGEDIGQTLGMPFCAVFEPGSRTNQQ